VALARSPGQRGGGASDSHPKPFGGHATAMPVVHVLSAIMTATAAPDIEDLYDLLQEQTAAERTNVSAQIALFSALVGLAPVAIVFGVLGCTRRTGDRMRLEAGSPSRPPFWGSSNSSWSSSSPS